MRGEVGLTCAGLARGGDDLVVRDDAQSLRDVRAVAERIDHLSVALAPELILMSFHPR
jgi:hypothetical protein